MFIHDYQQYKECFYAELQIRFFKRVKKQYSVTAFTYCSEPKRAGKIE